MYIHGKSMRKEKTWKKNMKSIEVSTTNHALIEKNMNTIVLGQSAYSQLTNSQKLSTLM
jgi:hypothetical protein